MSKLKTLFRLSCVTSAILLSSHAMAGGFQLWEQGIGAGDYHAGAAAEGDDASLEFYNPAQITELKKQEISVGGVIIPISGKFSGYVDEFVSPTTPSSGKSSLTAFIPNFHYVAPVTKRLYFAFGVTVPFGLETNYGDATGNMQLAATRTKLSTININPNIAYKLTDWMSVAVGVDALYGSADYDSNINGTPLTNSLSNWGVGYNLGAFFKFHMFKAQPTKIGLSFRSGIKVKAVGPSKLGTADSKVASATLNLPSTTILSIYQPINDRWAMMASVFYTNWSVFSDLVMNNTALGKLTIHEKYRNTWNFAVGTHIKLTNKLTWKLGGGYDQTPTRTGYRDVRLPDVNRWALSTGMRWQVSRSIALEGGYTHLFTPKATVDNSSSSTGPSLIPNQLGTADMNVNVYAMQISWAF